MSRNASAPFWARALIIVVLLGALVPAWLWLASHAFSFLAFRGKGGSAVTLMTWLDYWHFYQGDAGVKKQLVTSGAGAAVVLLAPVVLFFVKPRQSLHGTARFAKRGDIVRAGLLTGDGDGIIVGQISPGKYLMAGLAKFPHVMLAAPTGSGKGVGVVLPNLFNWNHSVVVLDIKKENWEITSGFRKAHGHAVFLFDPASPQRMTHRWNPLAYVRDDPNLRVDDVQKIGNIMFPDISGTDPIWTASCRSLFLGLVLYLFETDGKARTLGAVAREIYSGNDKRFKTIVEGRRAAGNPYSDACAHSLEDYVNTSDNTRTSIRKTFSSRFELFMNPMIDAATSANDFDLSDLRKRRISIYLGITPDNLSRMAPILNLFFQQLVDLHTRELLNATPELKYQCLLLMDEFKSLGKLALIVDAVAFLRGYGLRLLPIFQSPSQVVENYGVEAAKTFFQNHQVRITYTPANIEVATDISRELGNMTFLAKSKSTPVGLGKGNRSQSESEQARALLLPQEVMEIDDNEEIVFAKGCKPIKCTKIRWYEDKTFKDRQRPAPSLTAAPVPQYDAIDEPTEGSRPVEVGDLETIYERPMSDFSLDFSNVVIPSGDLDEAQAEDLADQLYAALTQ